MKNELIFGVAYYPEYMPFDRMDEDFRLMKKLGFNMIRIAESTWSTLEPSDGVWNFDYIDRTLAKAAEAIVLLRSRSRTAITSPGLTSIEGMFALWPLIWTWLWRTNWRAQARDIAKPMR